MHLVPFSLTVCCVHCTEPVFVNVQGAQEWILRNRFRKVYKYGQDAYFIMFMCPLHCKDAGVLEKLSLAGLAKLSRLRYG